MCLCVYIYTHTHIDICACMHVCMHACVCAHVHVQVHVSHGICVKVTGEPSGAGSHLPPSIEAESLEDLEVEEERI